MSIILKKLLNKKSLIINQTNDYKKMIISLENDRINIDKELWRNCDHRWAKCSGWGDLCKTECTICGLYNNHHIYNR